MKVMVRCVDKNVFPVNPDTLEPLSCGAYDPWCFSDPEPGVKYVEHFDWTKKKESMMKIAKCKNCREILDKTERTDRYGKSIYSHSKGSDCPFTGKKISELDPIADIEIIPDDENVLYPAIIKRTIVECRDCIFFCLTHPGYIRDAHQPGLRTDKGECHFDSPSMDGWPTAFENDFCGKGEPK